MAPLYSAHAGEPVTVAQLLGEPDETGPVEADAAKAAANRLEEILRKRQDRKERA